MMKVMENPKALVLVLVEIRFYNSYISNTRDLGKVL